jgi:Ferritin-like domain
MVSRPRFGEQELLLSEDWSVSKPLTDKAIADGPAVGRQPGERRALTRGQVLARSTVAAGALAAGGIVVGGLPKLAVSQPSAQQDARVLRWLLQVELLQAAFYTEVERRGALRGELREFAVLVGEQERAHVNALEKALGVKGAVKRAEFDFRDATTNPDEFVPTAVELEEIAVSAFNGQVPNLTRPRVMTAMKIVSVEARHVGWARDLAGRNPAPRPADRPATQEQTRAAIEDTGFME